MPHLLERVEGVEPSSLAWKARVIAVIRHPPGTSLTHNYKLIQYISTPTNYWWGGMDSNQRKRKLTDLQSAPFSHSGTPPQRISDYATFFQVSASFKGEITKGWVFSFALQASGSPDQNGHTP